MDSTNRASVPLIACSTMPGSKTAASNSPTPILDSGVLPARARRTTWRGLSIGFVLGLLWALMVIKVVGGQFENLFPGLGVLLLLFAIFLAITVHEIGHLSAGWVVGFRFSVIRIGPFSFSLEHGRLRVGIRREMSVLGYAGMHIDSVRRLHRRMLIYVAAGPIGNLLSVPATVLIVNYAFPRLGKSWAAVPAAEFAVISLMFVMMSLVPIQSGLLSDGARIAMLLRSRDRSRRWLSIAAIGMASNSGTRAKDWRRTSLQRATSVHDNSTDTFTGNWLAYLSANDRKDAATAADYLEKCLDFSPRLPVSLRDLVAQEAAVYSAWFRNDGSLADKWLTQVRKPLQMQRLVRLRLDVALRCGHQDYAAAALSWQEGMTFIERATSGDSQRRLKESWLEWQEEILERQSLTPNVLSREN
jgi:hypothetical protein